MAGILAPLTLMRVLPLPSLGPEFQLACQISFKYKCCTEIEDAKL